MINITSSSKRTPRKAQAEVLPDCLCLGLDLHKKSISVARSFDKSNPQPTQKMSWQNFLVFAEKQVGLAKKVYAVYEAGAFGYHLERKLRQMGIICYVCHPKKLDPRQRNVQTDKTDARNLCDDLSRYVHGHKFALVVIKVPTVEQELERTTSRHRKSLCEKLKSLQQRGSSILLNYGIFDNSGWWKKGRWEELLEIIPVEVRDVLLDQKHMIAEYEKLIKPVVKKIEAAAPASLPVGFGKLTFVLLMREIFNFNRFKNRRAVGGFTGLCGGVSSSGDSHQDLSINKAGSPFIRMLLIELAWRMVYYQPNYKPVKRWKEALAGHKRQKKRAIVAIARQLAIDIWRWQTGKVTAQELGWTMSTAA